MGPTVVAKLVDQREEPAANVRLQRFVGRR